MQILIDQQLREPTSLKLSMFIAIDLQGLSYEYPSYQKTALEYSYNYESTCNKKDSDLDNLCSS